MRTDKIVKISAELLALRSPGRECCDCGKSVEDDGTKVWTVLAHNARCTKCSRYEGMID